MRCPELRAAAVQLVSAGPRVVSPTLLIVDGSDETLLAATAEAFQALAGPREPEIIPGATDRSPEPRAAEWARVLAASWFAIGFLSTDAPKAPRAVLEPSPR